MPFKALFIKAFYLHLYFTLGSISLQSFYVARCFSITRSQRFGRFAIPFRVPILFSPQLARVTAAETSSREENGVHAWVLLIWAISRSPVDSRLDCMVGEVTLRTQIYSANQSQPSPGAGMHCRAK